MTANPVTILNVDDDEAKRYTVSRILKKEGFVVAEATSGEEALRQVARDRPDLIVLDVNMPDLDGFEVCRRLKANAQTASIPVLHLSATYVRSENKAYGLDAGADGYLTQEVEPAELLATIRAILRLKAAEERAQSLAAQWQATFDAISDGVCLLDLARTVVRCNSAFATLVGQPAPAVVGANGPALLAESGLLDELFASQRRQVIERQVGERWLRLTADPVWQTPGVLAGAVCIVSDISERKTAEAQRAAAALENARLVQELRQRDRNKDEFLATLAHELRNPLAPIRNSLHLLRLADDQDAAAVHIHEMLERQVRHLIRLVDDLMEVSRITRGKIELRRERVALADLVRNAVETSKPLIDAAGHQLSVELPAEPLVLHVDPVRTVQVLGNLLNNAAKYMDAGGQIWLYAHRAGNEAVLSVRDTGVGIAPDMLPRIFEMFTQLDPTTTRAQGGLGIGLTLVRSLVQLHGGRVEAYSAGPGRGSEFRVRLPLADTDAANLDAVPPEPALTGILAPRRILVVDDNRDAADSLGMVLEFLGAKAQVVYDGPTALAAVRTFQPAVVLLDVGMPGMDGYEVAQRVRAQPEYRAVVLVALTGWGQEQDRQQSHAAGFDHHLVKPVAPDVLQALLLSLEPGRGRG